jgi:colanic acid/amylovoran biosynthesis protein
MAILALGVGTPVLPLAYEFKIQELFQRLGHGRWVQDLETIRAESLTKALDSFLDQLPQMRKSLFVAVQKEREQALKSADVIKEVYERWQGARKGHDRKRLALSAAAQ